MTVFSQRLNFTNYRDPDRRTGLMVVEGGTGIGYSAHWDSDDNYPGYGLGRTSKEACDNLQELTDEWILAGRPEV